MIRTTTDVCIIGGGIYGLVVGYHLARAGVETLVVDKGRVGAEASGANAGSIGVQNKPIKMQALTIDAVKEWARLNEELGMSVGYERIGGFRVAHTEQDERLLHDQLPRQREAGVPLELYTGDDLCREAPYLNTEIRAATFCQLDGLSNPLRTNLAYAKAGQVHGLCISSGEGVVSVHALRSGFKIETIARTVMAGRLLNAAGAWSASIAAMLGARLPTTWAVNTVTITEPNRDLIPHLITHVRGNLTVKQHHGRVLIGGAWRGDGDPFSGIKLVNLENLKGNLAWACATIPDLRSFRMLRSWAGIQGTSPDRLFVMGPLPEVPGAFVFTAGSGGYTLAPYLGRLMAEWIVTSTRPNGLEIMDVLRFSTPYTPQDSSLMRPVEIPHLSQEVK